LHTGALLAVSPWRTSSGDHATSSTDGAREKLCRRVGLVLLGVSVIPAALSVFTAVGTVDSGGYGALYGQATSTGFGATPQVLAGFLFPGALFLLAGSQGQRKWVFLSGAVIGAYLLVHLFLGDRATAVFPALSWLYLYTRVVRRISARALVVAAVIAFVIVFPAVKQFRDLNATQRSELGLIGAFASVQNPALSTLSETGGSMGTIAATMLLVPSKRPFDNGAGYGYASLTAIPNIFWSLNPGEQDDYQSWLIQKFDPTSASLNLGIGFSYLAEVYINFGWFGPIACALIGFGISRLSQWPQKTGDVSRYALVATYLTALLFWPRAEASYVVRPLLWYALLPYLIILAFGSAARRKRSATRTKSRREIPPLPATPVQ
jgi:oligosaccharide repeat unit polymerase